MKKVILLIAVVAAITAGWLLYFDEGEPLAIVSVYEAKYSYLENALEFSGEVSSSRMYSVMSETGGTVSSLRVSEGNRVKIGDTLFTLDDTTVTVQLKEARLRANALREAGAQMVMAQQGGAYGMAEQKAKLALALSQTTGYDYESFNQAFGSEAAEQAQAVTASLAQSLGGLDTQTPIADSAVPASAEIELAELAVQSLESLLESMTYKSQIIGTVIAVNINEGEVLSPGLPAMVIADTDNSVVVGYVYEKDVRELEVGMDAVITTDTGTYPGKLTRIGAAAMGVGDLAAFDTMAKVEIEPEGGLSKLLGAVVDIKIVLSSKSDVLSIPIDCLTSDGCVFVVGDGEVAQKKAIVTGFKDAFNVEVIGGLAPGDRVVASPKGIEEGQRLSYDRG